MSRIFLVLVVVVAGVAGLGFYRGWFHLTSDRTSDTSNVTLTVDQGRIQEDKNAMRDKARDMDPNPQPTTAPSGTTP